MPYIELVGIAASTVDAGTGSLATSELVVQGHQRVNIGIVVGSLGGASVSIIQGGSFTGTIHLQRNMGDNPLNWRDVESWTIATESITISPEPETCTYRLFVKAGNYTSGDAVVRLGTS